MAFEVTLERNRTTEWEHSLYESDGATSRELDDDDVVRIKAYRRDGAAPVVDIDSAGANSYGSVLTVDELGPNPVASITAVFDQDETTLLDYGVYNCELSLVDASDGNRIHVLEQGVCYVMPSGGGDVGDS